MNKCSSVLVKSYNDIAKNLNCNVNILPSSLHCVWCLCQVLYVSGLEEAEFREIKFRRSNLGFRPVKGKKELTFGADVFT